MNEKPTIQIVLPVMPNPKDFEKVHSNRLVCMEMYRRALEAWERVSQSSTGRSEVSIPFPIANDGTKH